TRRIDEALELHAKAFEQTVGAGRTGVEIVGQVVRRHFEDLGIGSRFIRTHRDHEIRKRESGAELQGGRSRLAAEGQYVEQSAVLIVQLREVECAPDRKT